MFSKKKRARNRKISAKFQGLSKKKGLHKFSAMFLAFSKMKLKQSWPCPIFNDSKDSAVLGWGQNIFKNLLASRPRIEAYLWGQRHGLQKVSLRPRTSSRTPPLNNVDMLVQVEYFEQRQLESVRNESFTNRKIRKKTVEIKKTRLIGTTDECVTCFYFYVSIKQLRSKKF